MVQIPKFEVITSKNAEITELIESIKHGDKI